MSPAASWASLHDTYFGNAANPTISQVSLSSNRSFALSVYVVPSVIVDALPLPVNTEDQAAAGIASTDDARDSLLMANDVPRDVGTVLGHVGVRMLPNLVNYEATEEHFREAMGGDLGTEAVGADSRILLSNLIESWSRRAIA